MFVHTQQHASEKRHFNGNETNEVPAISIAVIRTTGFIFILPATHLWVNSLVLSLYAEFVCSFF